MKKSFAAVTLLILLASCSPSKPPESDYIVPDDIGAVQICVNVLWERRYEDSYCEPENKNFRWGYIRKGGHRELPAVGERVYRSETSPDRPAGLKVDRIPDEGGWWTE